MNLSDPLVSIGIPTYKRPDELDRLLRELCKQTYKNIEIIICDDDPDKSAFEPTQKYLSRDSRLRYFHNKDNHGAIRNLKQVLDYAKGDFFCWVSDDDWRAEHFVELCIDAFKEDSRLDCVFSNHSQIQEKISDYGVNSCNSSSKLNSWFFKKNHNFKKISHYLEDSRKGKGNVLFGMFRTDFIRKIDLMFISGNYKKNYTDILISYYVCSNARVHFLKNEKLVGLRGYTTKGYKTDFPHTSPLGKALDLFLYEMKLTLSYAKVERNKLISLIFVLIFPFVVAKNLLSRIYRFLKSSFYKAEKLALKKIYTTEKKSYKKSINLEDVTLVAVACTNVEKTIIAMRYSMTEIKFGACLLLSHYEPWNITKEINFKKIKNIKSIDDWSKFVVYDLNDFIKTKYILLVHHDGFVVNPDKWNNIFLDFDYIGPPWPLPKDKVSFRDKRGEIVRVGNSVSIRSKKILEAPTKYKIPWESYQGSYHEDGFLCSANKVFLESKGFKFAPIDIAKDFGHELPTPEISGIEPFLIHKWHGNNKKYPRFECF